MPNSENFNLKYRPRSYWGPQDLEIHYRARIKGELRRKTGLALLEEGMADEVALKSSLPDNERKALGAIHPWLMGGEYLSDLYPNEVEIARVVLKSTTMDVTSIRARHTKHRIVYRIVDEYGDLNYTLKPKTSNRPLELSQIIDLIDINELIDGPREVNYENGSGFPEEIYDFGTASSAFYPQLAGWYDKVNQEWLDRISRELEEADQLEEEEERRKANDPIFLKLSDWVKRAEYEHSLYERYDAPAGFGFAARAVKPMSIKAFVTAYYEKFSYLPTGIHSVPKYSSISLGSPMVGKNFSGEFEVRFPENPN